MGRIFRCRGECQSGKVWVENVDMPLYYLHKRSKIKGITRRKTWGGDKDTTGKTPKIYQNMFCL